MTYKHVYFRLDSGYQWGKGLDNEKSEAFHIEISKFFTDSGWSINKPKYKNSCDTAVKDKNSLYLHPMEASGVLQEDLIPIVEEILSKGTTFKHYRTDVYETLSDMSDDEYRSHLEAKKQDIINDLITGFTTKRSNLYIVYIMSVIERVKEKYHIPRITNYIGRSSDDIEWKYVDALCKELINNNILLSGETKQGIGYRSRTKNELQTA